MNLELTVEQIENNYILNLAGEIDAYTAPKLREVMIPLLELENVKLIVNLAGVSYMDSTGLGVFIGALKSSYKFGSTLKLQSLSSKIEQLFELTGLASIINIQSEVRGEK